MAVRARSLRTSVTSDTRTAPRVSKAYPSMSSFASALAPLPHHGRPSQV
jgi:hypothetical protein